MQGKTIVVTGAGGVLGAAVAKLAAERGAQVAGIDMAPIKDAMALKFEGVDLSDLSAATKVMDEIRAKAGRVDALLNIAGGFRWQTLADGGIETWDFLYKLNVKTAALASKAALPHLIESKGAIVNVGALGAVKAGAGMGAYAASKQGVMKLTESLAEEMKGQVRVNAVLPSIIDTDANRKDMPDADFGAWVRPVELANVMLWLAGDEASAVTGALMPVSGRV
jgi:NAD(P)-dependent dehydrogenase (short-subunit alcohol dehydrogenase family)